MLPDTGTDEARRIAESIRQAIEACQQLDGEDVDLSRVTASVGLASFPAHAVDAEGLFRRADDAMYAAKGAGRNRVAVAPESRSRDTDVTGRVGAEGETGNVQDSGGET